jgi:hypothetical protein
MADTVRAIMEAAVPELQDYEARGYFTQGEISAIAQRRQRFEYNLRRRNAEKMDFLRCVARVVRGLIPPHFRCWTTPSSFNSISHS